MLAFSFQPKWKEELVCTGAGGQFSLELSMGTLCAYLPTEEVWRRKGPEWARELWPQLREELERWCRGNSAGFVVDENAPVY